MGRGHRSLLKYYTLALWYDSLRLIKWFNKPRTIRIKKWKIIIGLYILWTLVPKHTQPQIVYHEPTRPTYNVTLLEPYETTTAVSKPLLDIYRIQNKLPDSPNLYEWGNCTYFVASQIKVPQNLGNANTWAYIASIEGYPVSNIPLPGAVAVSTAGYYGHVALVRAVENGQVLVAEANVYGLGVVDEAWYPQERFTYVNFS